MKYNVDIVVGLQFGSEAKGKIVEHIAQNYDIMVRTGAPNAGHTVYYGDIPVAFQQIPCGSIANENAKLVIGAGGLILKSVLKKEMEKLDTCGAWGDRLIIDQQACIIDKNHVLAEHGGAECPSYSDPMECDRWKELNTNGKDCEACEEMQSTDLWKKIGSTREGCGAALAARVWRQGGITQVKDDVEMMDWANDGTIKIMDTAVWLNEQVDHQARILLEGTQGCGLSMFHGYYPYCTSRDTNASNWLAEAGLSPKVVRDVIGVMRTFPIRVAGNSGPCSSEEISWSAVEQLAGAPEGSISEKTTVTKRIRRVFRFNTADVMKAIAINRPNVIALTFIDYLNWEDKGKSKLDDLSPKSVVMIKHILNAIGGKNTDNLRYLSTGPKPNAIIDIKRR